MVSRVERTPFAAWWWTVDRLLLAALLALMLGGIVLSLAASPPVASRLGLEPFYFVSRHVLYLVPALVVMLATSFLPFRYIRRIALVVFALSIILVAATLVCQLRQVPVYMTVADSARNRVLAAATFLIEQRPDLLRSGKVALLPTDEASNVGQYARGPYARIVMPFDYPAVLTVHGVASKPEVLKDFVEAYERRGEIKADWVVLTSSLLDDEGSARVFFQRLRDDPRIRWIATADRRQQ